MTNVSYFIQFCYISYQLYKCWGIHFAELLPAEGPILFPGLPVGTIGVVLCVASTCECTSTAGKPNIVAFSRQDECGRFIWMVCYPPICYCHKTMLKQDSWCTIPKLLRPNPVSGQNISIFSSDSVHWESESISLDNIANISLIIRVIKLAILNCTYVPSSSTSLIRPQWWNHTKYLLQYVVYRI